MYLDQIWRYPVKSMAGERLSSAVLHFDGIEGDRRVVVRDGRGRIITARTRPSLLGHRAVLGDDGEPRVDGRPWAAHDVAEDVRRAAGAEARLERAGTEGGFDVLPLLVATDGAIAVFGHDGRRLRPNLLIGGVEGLAERTWEGRLLAVGPCLVRLVSLRGRCVMTTYDPDTLAQNPSVLREIVERFDGLLALNAEVVRGGLLQVGNPVALVSGR